MHPRTTRLAALGFAFAAALCAPLGAQQNPSEVTDSEIARYKAAAKKACVEPGLARGDPQERVEAFCDCMLESLNKTMSRAEWQQAYFYSLKQQAAEEKNVVAPHLSKLEACRPKP